MWRLWWRGRGGALLVALAATLVAVSTVRSVEAQEGPECPGGFFWRANSGVGCMQEGCTDIGNAKYSYTGACICLDGFKGCFEPVDSSGVECGPFCPFSRLTACISPDASCPGEAPAPSGDEPSAEDADDTTGQPVDEEGPELPPADLDVSTDELVRDLEEFLAGERARAPSAGRAAAAGTATATLIGTWVLINLLSGARPADVLRAVSRWRAGRSAAASPEPQSDDTPTTSEPPETAETTDVAPDETPARTEPAEALPSDASRAPASESPTKPPDLRTLRRRRKQEVLEAKRRIELLHQLRKWLDREYRRLVTEWEVAWRCAAFDGVLDTADVWLTFRKKLLTSTVRGAYGKSVLKRAIKGAFRKVVRYRVDGTFELTPDELLEGAHKSLGVSGLPPGGALKQVLQDLSEGKGILGYGEGGSGWALKYGKGVSKVYGIAEGAISAAESAQKSKQRCVELRERMTALRTIFYRSSSALETAQADLEVAQSAIASIDEDIAELKTMFPHRFRDL